LGGGRHSKPEEQDYDRQKRLERDVLRAPLESPAEQGGAALERTSCTTCFGEKRELVGEHHQSIDHSLARTDLVM